MRNEESRYSAKTSMGYLRGERNFEISYAILCSLDIQQQTVNAKQLFPLSINLISRRDFVVSGLKLQGSTKLNMLFEVLPVCWHSLKHEFIGQTKINIRLFLYYFENKLFVKYATENFRIKSHYIVIADRYSLREILSGWLIN